MSATSDPAARREPAPEPAPGPVEAAGHAGGEAASQAASQAGSRRGGGSERAVKHRYPDGRPDIGRLVGFGFLGVLLAIIVNVVLARAATALLDPPAAFVPLRGANVVFLTLIATVLGVGVFLLLVLTSARPSHWFRVAAYSVALLSCLSPLSLLVGEPPRLAGTSGALVAAVIPLHLAPAAILAELLARRAWPER